MRTVLIGRATTLTVATGVAPPPTRAVPSGEVIVITRYSAHSVKESRFGNRVGGQR
jgi:hypothetical protein